MVLIPLSANPPSKILGYSENYILQLPKISDLG